MSNESELRRRLQALKRDEQRLAPLFPRLPRGEAARRPRVWPRLAGATAALLILIAIPLAVRRWSSGQERAQFASLSSWRAPTDFLLATPNRELLRSLPDIGTTPVPLTQGVPQ